ncbi:TetR/AcrR family transcriptional regulator [Nocardia neocaledoniensis]|uniref:TetR/AcrR family transcriptional regulator n=1 Tax=Nocardia neocaledoniensis TaxID=236511 RepID=UPI002456DB31|nr:TetR/AcrR family transcriptional regulator [Nocardia neocaledoniensis]
MTDEPRTYGGLSAAERSAGRRVRLLAAATALWGESGIASVTVRGVCKAAGLTPRYFYEHFANSDELLVAIADEVRDTLLAAMVRAGLSSTGAAEARLTAALQAFFDTVAADPHLHRIISSDPHGVGELAQRRHDAIDTVADLVVQYAPEALGFAPDPDLLRRASLFITGGVNQIIEGWLAGVVTMTSADLAADCARMCISVLQPGRQVSAAGGHGG